MQPKDPPAKKSTERDYFAEPINPVLPTGHGFGHRWTPPPRRSTQYNKDRGW